MSRVNVVVFFSLLTLLSLSGLAAAQVDPVLDIAPDTKSLAIGPGGQDVVVWTVTNNGPAAATASGQVTLQRPSVPAGWTIALDKTSFRLDGGASTKVTGTVVAPASGADAPQNGNIGLSGSIASQAQRGNTATSAPVSLSFNAPPPPAVVPPPPEDYTVLIVSAILFGVALLAAGAYWYFGAGVALVAETAAQPLNVGIDGVYKVRVHNKQNRARIVELRVRELPRTWFAAFSFPFVRLAAKESIIVPLYVKVPFTTSAGAVGALLAQARPQGPYPWRANVRVIANVIDVVIGKGTYSPAASAAPAEGAAATRVETTVSIDAPGVVVPLARWGALDEFTVQALAAADVHDTEDLLHAEPVSLAKQTGIAESHLRHLMAVADLVRVRGIEAKDAEALVRCGIRNLRDLVQETPESLLAKVRAHFETIGEGSAARKVSTKSTKRWIEAARDLDGSTL